MSSKASECYGNGTADDFVMLGVILGVFFAVMATYVIIFLIVRGCYRDGKRTINCCTNGDQSPDDTDDSPDRRSERERFCCCTAVRLEDRKWIYNLMDALNVGLGIAVSFSNSAAKSLGISASCQTFTFTLLASIVVMTSSLNLIFREVMRRDSRIWYEVKSDDPTKEEKRKNPPERKSFMWAWRENPIIQNAFWMLYKTIIIQINVIAAALITNYQVSLDDQNQREMATSITGAIAGGITVILTIVAGSDVKYNYDWKNLVSKNIDLTQVTFLNKLIHENGQRYTNDDAHLKTAVQGFFQNFQVSDAELNEFNKGNVLIINQFISDKINASEAASADVKNAAAAEVLKWSDLTTFGNIYRHEKDIANKMSLAL